MICRRREEGYRFFSSFSLGIINCQFLIIKWVAFNFISYYIFSFMNSPFNEFSFQNDMYKKLTDSISLPPQLLFEASPYNIWDGGKTFVGTDTCNLISVFLRNRVSLLYYDVSNGSLLSSEENHWIISQENSCAS